VSCSVDIVEARVERARAAELSPEDNEHIEACAACRAGLERARRIAETWRTMAPTRSEIARARARATARSGFDYGLVRWSLVGATLAIGLLVSAGRPARVVSDAPIATATAVPREPKPRAFLERESGRIAVVDGLRVELAPGESARIVGLSGELVELVGPRVLVIHEDVTSACGFRADDIGPQGLVGAPPAASPISPRPIVAAQPTKSEPAARGLDADGDGDGKPASAMPSAATSAWARAAEAMRNGDVAGADQALADLDRSPDASSRDAARLARAELWLANGHALEARPVLAELAQSGATPLVRKRAQALLAGQK
jgi:hypothetical protein